MILNTLRQLYPPTSRATNSVEALYVAMFQRVLIRYMVTGAFRMSCGPYICRENKERPWKEVC